MESVTLDCGWRQVRVCRAIGLQHDDSPSAWASLPGSGGLDSALLHRALAMDGRAREALRRMLDDDDDDGTGDASHRSTPALIQRIVEHVAAGHWTVQEIATTEPARPSHLLAHPKASVGGGGAPGITPSSLFGRRAAAPAPAVPGPAVDARLFERADHAVQAKVLKEAAAQGVPFCEVCEKARALREAKA